MQLPTAGKSERSVRFSSNTNIPDYENENVTKEMNTHCLSWLQEGRTCHTKPTVPCFPGSSARRQASAMSVGLG